MRASATSPLEVMLEISNFSKPVWASPLFQKRLRKTNVKIPATSNSERTASQYFLLSVGGVAAFVPDVSADSIPAISEALVVLGDPAGPDDATWAELLSRLSRSRSARISAALWQRSLGSFSSALL